MRLRYLRVDRALSCGGLLDNAELEVSAGRNDSPLAPLCLIGPNGTGKSQLLQLLAEIFQAAWNQFAPAEERESANNEALFEIHYEIADETSDGTRTVRLLRQLQGRRPSQIEMFELHEGDWRRIRDDKQFGQNLPHLVVGYTSGDNETLSLPFFVSRGGYAEDVREAALPSKKKSNRTDRLVADNRLLLIDYSTHLEVLVANLLLGEEKVRRAIISHANLDDLASFRCIVQLNHSAAPSAPKGAPAHRKGVQLTSELEGYIPAAQRTVSFSACRLSFRVCFSPT